MLTDFAGLGGHTRIMQPQLHSFGSKAALAAALASIGYAIPQILQVLGLLPDPWDRVLIFAPSLLLAPSFVCTVAAAAQLAEPGREAVGRGSLRYLDHVCSVGEQRLYRAVARGNSARAERGWCFRRCAGVLLAAYDIHGNRPARLFADERIDVVCWPAPSAARPRPKLRGMLLVNGVAGVRDLWPADFRPALIYPAAIWLVSISRCDVVAARTFQERVTISSAAVSRAPWRSRRSRIPSRQVFP